MSNATETRPLKRRRLPSETPPDALHPNPNPDLPEAIALKRHEALYFDDGNIVLAAKDIAFRVYRGLLAAQSTVFADMFVAAESGARVQCDDCPMVELSDSPHDLAHLLSVLIPKEGQK